MAARTHIKNKSVPRRYSLPERLEHYSMPEPNSGCLLWLGHADSDGYGSLMFNYKVQKAHRWAWEYHKGPIQSGLMVCHKCDNRLCINSNHLFVGTALDNNKDRSAKGRTSNKHIKARQRYA